MVRETAPEDEVGKVCTAALGSFPFSWDPEMYNEASLFPPPGSSRTPAGMRHVRSAIAAAGWLRPFPLLDGRRAPRGDDRCACPVGVQLPAGAFYPTKGLGPSYHVASGVGRPETRDAEPSGCDVGGKNPFGALSATRG